MLTVGPDGWIAGGQRAIVSPAMLCPNCMSPYVEPLELEAEGDAEATEKAAVPEETILRCTECEYSAPRSEFVPENYR